MKLRIHRSWEWKCTLPLSEIRFGGDNPLSLVPTDTFEYLDTETSEWKPIETFEDPIPEHPRDAKLRMQMDAFMHAIDIEALRKILGDPTQSVSFAADPNVLLQNTQVKVGAGYCNLCGIPTGSPDKPYCYSCTSPDI